MFDVQRRGDGESRYEVVSRLLAEVCAVARCRAAVLANDDCLFVAGWGGADDELEALACGSPHVFIGAPRLTRTLEVVGQTLTLTMVDEALPPELDAQLVRVLAG